MGYKKNHAETQETHQGQTKSSHFSIVICSVCLVSYCDFCVQAWSFCATWLTSCKRSDWTPRCQVIRVDECNLGCFALLTWNDHLRLVRFTSKPFLVFAFEIRTLFWREYSCLLLVGFLWVLYPGLPLLLFRPTACVVDCRRTARDCNGLFAAGRQPAADHILERFEIFRSMVRCSIHLWLQRCAVSGLLKQVLSCRACFFS